MLAVLGTDGGPSTAVALGLARASARDGESTLVVDVDAAAPALHLATGVDREPTVASLAATGDVGSAVHRHPEVPHLGVLPAPLARTSVGLATALDRLSALDAAVLVDCPIGAGPAVADVLAAADRAVVVSPNPSTGDCARAVAFARTRGAPVPGVVVADDVGDDRDFEAAAGAPLLGTVPESRSSRNAATEAGYDELANALKAKSYESSAKILFERMVGRLETGIDVLDRKLDGGLPPGCVVAFTADPASQSELLLYELTAARGTLYVTTERTDDVVRHALESSQARVGSPTVRHVSTDEPLEETERLVNALPDGANLIVDTMNVLERTDRDEYREFLNGLKGKMLETGSIAVLHCLSGDDAPENRSTTLHVADAVFDLETTVGGTEVENYMTIPKFRAGGAPTERIKLELSEAVTIDTSRDIA